MKEAEILENNKMGAGNGMRSTGTSYLARISLFWLIVGGLLLFFGVTAIMQRAGIWSEADAENAGDGVIIMLGILAIAYALKDDRHGARRDSA